jgi:phosphoglycerol transferase
MAAAMLKALKRAGKGLGWFVVYLAIWLGIFLLIAGIGILMVYGPTPVDQVIFNAFPIKFDSGGIVVWIGVLGLGVAPILITLLIAFFHIRRRRKIKRNGGNLRPGRARWVPRAIGTTLVTALLVGGFTTFSTTVSLPQYVKAATSSYSVSQYYKTPQATAGKKKNNLVLIYLESGEGTLSDTKLFDQDPYIPLENATKSSDGWKSIDNFKQFEGGGWTMAGITSTSCGIPLKSNGLLSGKSGLNEVGGVNSYLGGVTCLGDILKNNGYNNVFMGGANASIASKNVFLKTHGYDTEYDLKTWQDEGNEPKDEFRPDWGLSDRRLMDHAKTEVDKLHATAAKGGQPFNLSMLTLDTHEPPHMYPYCKDTTENPLTSVYRCSNQQVASFVNYMKKKGYLKDTAVVIMGDHYKHMNPSYSFHKQLDNNPDRTIFNRIWVPGDEENKLKTRSGIDQLNLLPTILEATGFNVKDRQAGLGVSAFATKSQIPKDSAQAMSAKDYKDMLNARSSDFYKKAWGDVAALDKGKKVDPKVDADTDDGTAATDGDTDSTSQKTSKQKTSTEKDGEQKVDQGVAGHQ